MMSLSTHGMVANMYPVRECLRGDLQSGKVHAACNRRSDNRLSSHAPYQRRGSRYRRGLGIQLPRANNAGGAEQAIVEGDASVYFEPFLRSFVLGASAGVAFEAVHVAFKLVRLVQEVGLGELAQALPRVSERFAPLFVDDHVVALGCWLLFYAIEVYAVMRVLDKHSQNPAAAASALEKLTTLPRLMLPRLKVFKHALRLFGVGSYFGTAHAVVGADIAAPRFRGKGTTEVIGPYRPNQAPPLADPRQEPEAPSEPRNKTIPEVEREVEEAQPLLKKPPALEDIRAKQNLRPGQLAPSAAELLHRQKELSSRRAYLQNFWYAVGISEHVKEKPVGVEILGEKVVLFRDSKGQVSCLSNVCPHRGAPLSLGWRSEVKGHECIVCPYHGWAFDQNGRLQDVPAAEERNDWPQKPLINSYPVVEKGGFIWLFYGSKALPKEERPPIPYVPELDNPDWKPVFGEIEFECSHWSVFENAIDMAHIHYLHNDSFGNQGKPQIKGMAVSSNAYGIEASFALHNKPVNPLWEFSRTPEVQVGAKALLPSSSVIGFKLAQGLSFITFVNTVPISATRTINRFALIRRLDVDQIGSFVFNMPAWDAAARNAMIKILSQDKVMVEQLMPEMLGREISVKADLPQIAFRKLRQQYIDMGYGVAPELASGSVGDSQLDM